MKSVKFRSVVHWYVFDDTAYVCGQALRSGKCSVNLSEVTCKKCRRSGRK